MFISSSSPSHGFGLGGFSDFLFVRPSMFVSRDVSGSVNYVYSSCLTLPAAGVVKTLLVWPGKLGGVCETAHCRGSHGFLWGNLQNIWIYSANVAQVNKTQLLMKSYRDSSNDRCLPLDQLEDLSLSILSSLFFIFLSGKLSECNLELVKCDGATGFLPEM